MSRTQTCDNTVKSKFKLIQIPIPHSIPRYYPQTKLNQTKLNENEINLQLTSKKRNSISLYGFSSTVRISHCFIKMGIHKTQRIGKPQKKHSWFTTHHIKIVLIIIVIVSIIGYIWVKYQDHKREEQSHLQEQREKHKKQTPSFVF